MDEVIPGILHFDVMLFSHGAPVPSGGKAMLRAFLEGRG